MGSRRLPRLVMVFVTAFVATGVIAFASPARANMIININPGNLNTTASEWDDHECTPQLGGGPFADKDIWIFNLAGNHETTGDFLSLTITFKTPSGDVVKTIPGPDSGIVLQGHSKAWIAVPAGYVLTAASAEISGEAAQFVLTHTCPANGSSPSPSPSPSPSNGDGGGGGDGGNGGGGGGGNGGPLPTTGTAVTGLIISGLLLAGSGVALVYLQRRRRIDVDEIS